MQDEFYQDPKGANNQECVVVVHQPLKDVCLRKKKKKKGTSVQSEAAFGPFSLFDGLGMCPADLSQIFALWPLLIVASKHTHTHPRLGRLVVNYSHQGIRVRWLHARLLPNDFFFSLNLPLLSC